MQNIKQAERAGVAERVGMRASGDVQPRVTSVSRGRSAVRMIVGGEGEDGNWSAVERRSTVCEGGVGSKVLGGYSSPVHKGGGRDHDGGAAHTNTGGDGEGCMVLRNRAP